MKKVISIFLIMTTVIMLGCGYGSEAGISSESIPGVSARLETTPDYEYSEMNANSIPRLNDTEQINSQSQIPDDVDSYLDAVKRASNGEVVYNLYMDFDGDGTNEMFALVQNDPSESKMYDELGAMGGRLWYVNKEGAIEVSSVPRPYYKDPVPMTFGSGTVLPLHQVFTTGTRTYLWGVLGGKSYELNASGRINGLYKNEYGEIEGTGEAYNSSRSKDNYQLTGHTWNTYYFYYDHGNIREYGGMDISWEDFCRIPGIQSTVDYIESQKLQQGEEIDSIYYRSNGIVVVNFEDENEYSISYSNMQLRITDQGIKLFETYDGTGITDGTVESAFLDDLASFPDEFPY